MLTVEDIEYAVSQMERYGIEEGVSGYRKYYADETPEEDGEDGFYEGPNLYFTIQFYKDGGAVKWDVVEDLIDYPDYYQGIGSRDIDDDAVAYQAVIPCEFSTTGIASFSDMEILNAMFENGYDEPLIDNTEEGLQR